MKVVAHHAVTTLAWHPTGQARLYVGREDGKVVFLDIHDGGLSGSYKLPISSDHSDSVVRALALDHSGMHLAVAKGNAPTTEASCLLHPISATVCVDPAQPREAVRWHLVPPSYRMGRPAISPDQTLLAVFNCLDGFDIYSMGSTVEMPQLLHTFRVEVSKNLLLPVVFINDGKSIVLGSANGSVLITSVTNVTSRPIEVKKPGDIIQALAYHRIGSVHYVASATSEKGVDTYVKIWKAGLPTLDVRRPRAQLGLPYYISAAVTIALITILIAYLDDLKPSIDVWVNKLNSTTSRLQTEFSQFLSGWKTRIIRWLLQLLSESDVNF
ncbi:hypothetical protein EYR40_005864 [Pleurotus pulmonarius]|nr:hypothetical protein EYR40_005864 [Pleurotus pulmonarius]